MVSFGEKRRSVISGYIAMTSHLALSKNTLPSRIRMLLYCVSLSVRLSPVIISTALLRRAMIQGLSAPAPLRLSADCTVRNALTSRMRMWATK